MITKDYDFLDSYYLKGIPPKLLLITTGNITNQRLLALFSEQLTTIVELFHIYSFVELSNTDVIGHE